MISGLLQTSEYAREFLHLACGPLSCGQDQDQIDQMVATRMQRRRVPYQPAKPVQVVMLEGALRARVVSVPTLAGQLDRLLAVTGLPALELSIIAFAAAVPVFPLSGFRLYGDLVIVESIVGEQQLAEAGDVACYEKYLEFAARCGQHEHRGRSGDPAVTGELAVIYSAGMLLATSLRR